MAVRRKKDSNETGAPATQQEQPRARAPRAKQDETAPKKSVSRRKAQTDKAEAAELMQTVAADVVPTGPVEVDVPARPARGKKTVTKGSRGHEVTGSRGAATAGDEAKARVTVKNSEAKPSSERRKAPRKKAAAPVAGKTVDVTPPASEPTAQPPGFVAQQPIEEPLPDSAPPEAVAARKADDEPLEASELRPAEWSDFAGADVTPEVEPDEIAHAHATASDEPARETKAQPAEGVIDPQAIREHRVDQIAPVQGNPSETAPNDSLLSDWDLYLFNEGSHHNLWEKLGAHMVERDGVRGTNFAVWAPNAQYVSVVGEFNGWDRGANPMSARGASGIWETFVPDVGKGTIYKYHIASRFNGYNVNKADPFGVHHETPAKTGSIVWDLEYEWNDDAWMKSRRDRNSFEAPMSIYEVHIGSWRHVANEDGSTRPMSYREMAQPLAEYVQKMNFTHVEFLPVMEHPFFGSWGYQCTGYFAPSSRFGTPQDFKYLVDVLHQHGIGVILDWVPSHFPTDEHGLAYFDGTHLFEHADPRKGFHPDWGSYIFNYGRNEVRSFLLSSAIYWLSEYHADGLRVDAVASMLYLDYSRKHGEWIPNEFGGRENIEAISFLRRLNEDVYNVHPDVQVIAEESTAWPMVSRPTYVGGLGFGMKWDMGWMHDSLRYFSKDPVHRRYHHNDLTFRMMYAFTENFVLPLSHDEVVHGKGSLIGKMPGDEWRRFANLRLLFAHMYSQPAKKLIFMGGEIAQWREWNHDASLDWHALDFAPHEGMRRWVEDLNKAYRDIPAFHELDMDPAGFEWIDCCDSENSVLSLARRSKSNPGQQLVVILNFTPEPRYNYQVGVPRGGRWTEVLNSDAPLYGGSGQGNMGGVDAAPIPLHGRRWSVTLTLPPLGAVFLLSGDNSEDDAQVENAGIESASVEAEGVRE